ncbi:PcfK-like protein [Prevotellaceae bacterium KH2P17]|nr:PcfK-like protein [Prevotellaceae bacterium KH2P17]
MKGTEHFTRTIAEYLNQRAMTDPLFAPNLMKPKKSIEECVTYILNQVQKCWKSRARLTPEGKATLPPENFFILPPLKS